MTAPLLTTTQVNRAALTPMMQHYIETKDQYPHALVLYRLGDFYEAFFEDAQLISRELELVLTGREGGKEIGRIPMAGIPHHALDRYAAQLVEKGFSIAICDQMESAAVAQGLVRREVTRVITPGTVIEEGMLPAKRNNFLVAVVNAAENWGLAYADISTGEFQTTQLRSTEQLVQELLRLQPAEVLLPMDSPNLHGLKEFFKAKNQPEHHPTQDAIAEKREPIELPSAYTKLPDSLCYTQRSQTPFSLAEAKQRLLETFRVRSLEGFGCNALPLAIRASGGLLEYLSATQKNLQTPLQNLSTYTVSDYLLLDHQTRRNLEITQTVRDSTLYGSLLWALDKTTTAMGSRALRRWLLQPLKNIQAIGDRADTVAELSRNHSLRKSLRHVLNQIYDIERLCSRVGAGTANARDLIALAQSLGKLRDVSEVVLDACSPYLIGLQQVPLDLEQLGDRLVNTLVEQPPIYLTEGDLIRAGVNSQLDELRQQAKADLDWLANLEKLERERTGISTLKLGYNKAFGYYISISKGKSDQAPKDYKRKQTLTNEERYVTPELEEREARIAKAKEALNLLEYELFIELRTEVAKHIEPMRAIAQALAAADALCSFAEVAVTYNYCRPVIAENRSIQIKNGRHPVVEQSLPAGFFVPNSVNLGYPLSANPEDTESSPDSEHPDLIVLTGPNMSGKSIFLRQVGLIQLMAQVGSFVPADVANLGLCDRIFTRVGAVDDLATGQSTFMVEMNETANILNHAKETSLVLLDEIGRGTSTFDGMAIAWSVAEYLATALKARAIFATHYHELNELASLLPNVANFQVTVKELEDEIIFLHQVQPGGADRSYGIEVGRLAGLPPTVISRAKQLLAYIDRNSRIATGLRNAGNPSPEKAPAKSKTKPDKAQLSIFDRDI
ncbi:DNA mismatch repair protein MutS [Tumidithrix elongata RA019]|uniref:DNA mismatch repair protein MutS n=1 Tax=Tumidithrix elongata BACA0141 TaxID=2716417 RepID=A0AAW9PX25_9CYAN|nr:DNA mismatch repair protein MutS [Tumidithrix elongata RA019]